MTVVFAVPFGATTSYVVVAESNGGISDPAETFNADRLLFPEGSARFTSTVYVFSLPFGAVTSIKICTLVPASPRDTVRLVVVCPLMLTLAPASCGCAVTVTLATELATFTV